MVLHIIHEEDIGMNTLVMWFLAIGMLGASVLYARAVKELKQLRRQSLRER